MDSQEVGGDATRDEIVRLCGGNLAAVDLIYGAWARCEIWDDLVDKDKAVSPEQVNDLLLWALFELHRNPVYQAVPDLHLLLRVTISNWLASNVLSKGDEEDRATAYVLRCAPYDFFVGVILAVSGPAMADEAALFFRSFKGSELLAHYLKEKQ